MSKKYNKMTALEFAKATYHNPVCVDEALDGRSLNEKIQFFEELNILSRKTPHSISTNNVIANIFRQISKDIDEFEGIQGLKFWTHRLAYYRMVTLGY